jgi:hypothetical protein
MVGEPMSKREMAYWYYAVCEASEGCRDGWLGKVGEKAQEEIESWDSFFMEWARQLFVEAGRPKGFPWRMDGA